MRRVRSPSGRSWNRTGRHPGMSRQVHDHAGPVGALLFLSAAGGLAYRRGHPPWNR